MVDARGTAADGIATAGTDAEANGAEASTPEATANPMVRTAAVPSAHALRLAESALDEIAPRGAVGDIVDAFDEDGVLALRYASQLGGYPDWYWTVTLSQTDPEAPTVLEVALLPGDGALTAPEWVPWADRLADYLAAKEAGEASDGDDEDLDDDDDDDDDDGEESDGDDADAVAFEDFDEVDLVHDDDDHDGVGIDDVQPGAAASDAGRPDRA